MFILGLFSSIWLMTLKAFFLHQNWFVILANGKLVNFILIYILHHLWLMAMLSHIYNKNLRSLLTFCDYKK